MNKPCWHCREFGEDGFVFIAVDQMLPDGTMIGLRHAIHPFELDQAQNPRTVLVQIFDELTAMLERASAQPPITSRACAFGG